MPSTGDYATHVLTLKPSSNNHEPLILTFCVTYIGEAPDWTYDCYCTEITRVPPAQGGAYSMEIELKSENYKTWHLADAPFELGDFGADADPEEVGVELTFKELMLRAPRLEEEGNASAMARLVNGDLLVTENWDTAGQMEMVAATEDIGVLHMDDLPSTRVE